MSNETKRDVFDEVLEELADAYIALDGEGIGDELTNEDKQAYLKDYDNALPDDLLVIPEAVGGLIKVQKARCLPLSNVLGAIYNLDILRQEPSSRVLVWVKNNEDTFARAWVLGAWKVKETGEIVKLEEEK
ncbi:hypothetical protein [Lacticaseibacillus paracasei]|uniref:hypothetical protein n=1 Tax=Lacticaseibacillus paracasei TaxID=1597 RepID=UPI0022E25493|nr:hypothetical protein [Lacticaseibacillus paracasei]